MQRILPQPLNNSTSQLLLDALGSTTVASDPDTGLPGLIFSDFRGTQLDNIVVTSSVPEGSTLSLIGLAALLFLGCRFVRRRMKRETLAESSA
jgi:hypothetical protein